MTTTPTTTAWTPNDRWLTGVVLAVVGAALGLAIGLGFFLLFKVLPLMLVGYVVMRLVAPKSTKQLSEADRKWLES